MAGRNTDVLLPFLICEIAWIFSYKELQAMRQVCKDWREGFDASFQPTVITLSCHELPTLEQVKRHFPHVSKLRLNDSWQPPLDTLRHEVFATYRDCETLHFEVKLHRQPGQYLYGLPIRKLHLGQVESLGSSSTSTYGGCLEGDIDDASLQHIVSLQWLETLSLATTQVTDSGLTVLAELQQLTRLDLYSCTGLSCACLAHLRSSALVDLSLFRYDTDMYGTPGSHHLCNLTQLKRLDMGEWCAPSDLLYVAGLTNLTSLILNHNRLDDVDVAQLAPLQQLHELQLYWNDLKDACVQHFSRMPLTRLDLGINNVTDACLDILQRLPLVDLSLKSNMITDLGLAVLATMSSLTALNVEECDDLTDAGLLQLVRLPLKHLTVTGTPLLGEQLSEALGAGCTVDVYPPLDWDG